MVQWSENDRINQFLAEARRQFGIAEIFFLQTCNRREFYIYAEDLEQEVLTTGFLDALSQSVGQTLKAEDFYVHSGRSAAVHLFRVASSLDSMVIGETEIMKQIKDQSANALACGNMGRRLKALVQVALRTAKQVRHHTHITKNVTSMASLIFRRVSTWLPKQGSRKVVFVGAGHFIRSILPTFTKIDDLDLIFVNRSLPTQLAEQYGGRAISLTDFLDDPVDFDAMITATGASQAIFTKEWLAARQKNLLLLDAALPADIETGAHDLKNVSLLDLKEMEEVLASNRAAREAEIPKAEPLFEEGWERLQASLLECDLACYNQQISVHYQAVGARALDHLLKEEFDGLSDSDAARLKDWTQSLVKKLTTVPILGLKGVARDLGNPAVHAYTRNVAEKTTLFNS